MRGDGHDIQDATDGRACALAGLLIDCEEDRTLRTVLVEMLRGAERQARRGLPLPGSIEFEAVYTYPPHHSLNTGMESVEASPDELGIREDDALGGTAASFEELFVTEQHRLHQALFVITGSRQEAEDIGQEAFLRLWERWDRIRGLADPVGYLHRTAINVYRDRSRRLLLTMKRAVGMAPQPNEYGAVEARSMAASVLRQLPPRQRAALVLTEGLGYSAEEAGQLLGIKGSTVRALHFQARSALSGIKENKGIKENIDG